MRFSPAFLDDIRDRVSISSVVGRAVQWDRRKTNAGRGDYWACCPFHSEKSPSFHAEDSKGRYYCFGCKASGDIFRFLVEKQGMAFPEAVEQLASEAGLAMPVVSAEARAAETTRASLYDVMELAAQYFEQNLQSPAGAAARGYLAGRGISPGMQKTFRIGYAANARHALKTWLASKDISADLINQSGVVVSGEDIAVSYDRFRDRVMFPIRDARGRVIAFGGRALSPGVPAKYLNSPETPLFHKGAVLYNFDQARAPAHKHGTIVAVEGYMDVIAMARAGIAHAVAPLGTALTPEQIALMWRIAPEPVLCFDGDEAGMKAAYRALDTTLGLLAPGQSLRFALLPNGQDPDDLLKNEGAGAIKAVVDGALPLSDMLWRRALETNDRATPERRALFESSIRNAIAAITDERVRHHYQADLRARTSALWRQSGASPAKGASRHWPGQRARTTGKPYRGGRARRPEDWELAIPASNSLKASALARAGTNLLDSERREHLMILCVLNHPELLYEDAELLSDAEIHNRQLEHLKRAILDAAALNEDLDSAALRAHLDKKGLQPAIAGLERRAGNINAWFVDTATATSDARTGLQQMAELHRKAVTLERELRAAEQMLAEDPSVANLDHLNEIREQLQSQAGHEASIRGFGEASGRPADILA